MRFPSLLVNQATDQHACEIGVGAVLLQHQPGSNLAGETLQTLTAPIYVTVNSKGVVLAVSTQGALYLDYSPEEIIGQPVMVLVHSDQQQQFQQLFSEFMQYTHQGVLGDFYQVGKDGISSLKRVLVQFLQDNTPEPMVLLIFESVSRPVLDGDQYALFFHQSSDGLFVHSFTAEGHPGPFLEVNDVGCRLLGYSREELLQRSPLDLVLDPTPVPQDVSTLFAQHHHRFEVTLQTRWGTTLAVEISQRLLTVQGQPVALCSLREIADRLELEATLRQQSDLYRQVQRLNAELERQTQARAIQLRIAFEFEATLKRITDKVRDSLDESQILQTVVQELAIAIGVTCCNAALYDLRRKTSTICYEYTTAHIPFQGRVVRMEGNPEIYTQLTRGQAFQFCSVQPNLARGHVAMLACPILEDQVALGDLWLTHHKYYAFSEQDIRLVQQVANQCAIAIRQARLYQASQKQIELLEKLNQLKDDFLSTVSHELRTPMANMRMAMQMLTIALGREGLLKPQHSDTRPNKIAHYLQILQDECHREITLINDLLDLQRLEAGARSPQWEPIDLQSWLPQIIQPFQECTQSQEQSLWVDVPLTMTPLVCDADCLERILRELLTNAYKYTPKGGEIRLIANAYDEKVSLTVQNSGVQIPEHELSRVFDKFYRVPNNDPWKHGGTGLGLALVKQLTEQLGAHISVASSNHQTSFTLVVPTLHHLSSDI